MEQTGGAQVAPVGGGPLHTLHDPDLGRGEVQVEHWEGGQGAGLPKAADVAPWRTHAVSREGVDTRDTEEIKCPKQI